VLQFLKRITISKKNIFKTTKITNMKKKIFLAITVCFFATLTTQANIWRVNNDASKGADYTTIQACIDNTATFNGDTVHIEPSAITYAAFTLNKRIFIFGNGYFLTGAGSNTGLQQNVNTSRVNGIIFNQGSAATPTSGANLCLIAGLDIVGPVQLNNVAGVRITRCLISGQITFANYASVPVAGISFTKNYITDGIGISNFTGTPSVDVTFENNIFSAIAGFANGTVQISLPTTMKGLFRNNIYNEGSFQLALSNFYVTNNIFTAAVLSNTNVNNVYKNNIFVAATANNGVVNGTAGNVTGVALTNIFASNVTSSTTVGDNRFNLLVGGANPNPAVNGGETIGAVVTPECGAYGATDPYRPSGIHAIPTIYFLNVPSGVAAGATSMQISVSTRSNN
jgi:hypothetical protein